MVNEKNSYMIYNIQKFYRVVLPNLFDKLVAHRNICFLFPKEILHLQKVI